MNIKESFKGIFGAVGGIVIFLGVIVLGVFLFRTFISGSLWLSSKLLPWLTIISLGVLGVVIFVLLPLAIPKATRGFSSIALLVASYIFGITLWMMGLLITYFTWGMAALIIGLLAVGVGVVPIAIVASLVKGVWGNLIMLVLMIVATYGCRLGALTLGESLEE